MWSLASRLWVLLVKRFMETGLRCLDDRLSETEGRSWFRDVLGFRVLGFRVQLQLLGHCQVFAVRVF